MDLLSQVQSAKQNRPRRILLYGVEGVGKSTWAAAAPDPIVISTEDGISDIDVPAFPRAEKFADVMQATYELATKEHQYKTLVLDSADWFEKFIYKQVCDTAGTDNINDPYNKEVNFGKGYLLALDQWDKWLKYASLCRDDRNMNVILIAHSHTPQFKDPSSESYNRYEPKMHKTASERLREWSDEVLFATYETFVAKHDDGFKERTQAVGSGKRILKCSELPSHKAKNRLGLPPEIDMDATIYWDYVKGKTNGNAE